MLETMTVAVHSTTTPVSGLISSVPCAASRPGETGSQAFELHEPALGLSQEGCAQEQHCTDRRSTRAEG